MRAIATTLFLVWTAAGADRALPPPRTEGGRPLMQALKLRKTTREFRNQELAPQILSDLLWAAFGVNRPDGKRTAPSAWDQREIDLYLLTAAGVFVYGAEAHALRSVMEGDHREGAGKEFAAAPLTIVYVADFERAAQSEVKDRLFYSGINTGHIAQNVYLFCASEGLATVEHDAADKPALAKRLRLRAQQVVILSQAVGYPR
jgi:hypothetical protein